MKRPNPQNPIGPLMQVKCEMQELSDIQILKLEKKVKNDVKNGEGLDNQRVDAFFDLLENEKERRNI